VCEHGVKSEILALDAGEGEEEIGERDIIKNPTAEAAARSWIRIVNSGVAVRPFGYVFDPLFLICCGLYAANRWLIKPHCHIVFFHSWFNDLWLIPCALPPLLLVHRWLGLRSHDEPPTFGEVAAHWVGWSILFEVIGPHIMRTTGDPLDAASYAVGAGVGLIWWRAMPWQFGRGVAGFDWLAPHYRWMERILAGGKLQRCRTAFLGSIAAPRRALLLGVGHGRFLTALRQAYPQTRCVCVDASGKMLEAARKCLEAHDVKADGIEFVQADLTTWEPGEGVFDLIAGNFIFDCFTDAQLEPIIARIAKSAAPRAQWLVADFHAPEHGVRRWRAQAILTSMYLFFRWATGIAASRLPQADRIMRGQGFVLRERRASDWGLLQSDLWELPTPAQTPTPSLAENHLNAACGSVC
jgi:ubiquinone/menaquinone biosynthesis C-methylase UbiE